MILNLRLHKSIYLYSDRKFLLWAGPETGFLVLRPSAVKCKIQIRISLLSGSPIVGRQFALSFPAEYEGGPVSA